MESQQIMELLLAMREDRKTDQAKADAHRAEIKSGQAEMREEIRAIRADVKETIRQRMEDVMTRISLEKQNLHKELTEKIEKAPVKLQAVEVSLDTRATNSKETLRLSVPTSPWSTSW
jgi:hypothetical protein